MWQTPLFLLWTLCSAIFFTWRAESFGLSQLYWIRHKSLCHFLGKGYLTRIPFCVYRAVSNWSYLESWALSIWSFNIITLSLTSLLIIVFFEQEIWACLSKDVKLKSRRTQQHLIVCFVKTAARPPEHRGETWRGRWAGANPFPAPPRRSWDTDKPFKMACPREASKVLKY